MFGHREIQIGSTVERVLVQGEIRTAFWDAWLDSSPGSSDAHEEGGFVIVKGEILSVERWPVGMKNEIVLPDHKDCKYDGSDIVASFHTHPNIGKEFQQEPSLTDIRAVQDDPDLKGDNYVGEFVISAANIYLIEPSGKVTIVGETASILAG